MVLGEIFLSAFLQVLFDRLAPEAHDFWNFAIREGLKKKLKKLEELLLTTNAVLADAEEKQLTNEAVKVWLLDLRDLADDVEDVLDEFATQALRQKLMTANQNCMRKFKNIIPTSIKFKFEIKSKIKDIMKSLNELSEKKKSLGLMEIAGVTSRSANLWQRPPTTSLPEKGLCGRDEDKRNVIKMLKEETNASSDDSLCVVPIVGMGGLGKTTLAQQVYNDPKVQHLFQPKVWVCASNDFDVLRITRALLEGVTFLPCDLKELDPIQRQLQDALTGKRFLIVLQDSATPFSCRSTWE